MSATEPTIPRLRATMAALKRHRAPDDPDLLQARRALKLASTEHAIAQAIENAPPLDADTVARLHALIPAPADLGQGGGR